MITKESPCSQDGCQEKAAYRYTWPGKDEAGVCVLHFLKLMQIADAMGLHLQIIKLEDES